jgi:hypothetical protein
MQFFTLIDIDKIKDKDTGGAQTMSNKPLQFYYNHGLGFLFNGVDPIKRQKQEPKIDYTNDLPF